MKKQTGMTLIELMTATVIIVIMAAVATPFMKTLLDRSNLKVVGPIFEKSIRFARSEAIQRSQTVRLSPLSASSDWSQGWRIDAVTNSNLPSETLQLIRTFDALPGDTSFTSKTFNGTTTKLDILPNGQTPILGTFTLNKAGCIGDKYTYNLLLSGILIRSVSSC